MLLPALGEYWGRVEGDGDEDPGVVRCMNYGILVRILGPHEWFLSLWRRNGLLQEIVGPAMKVMSPVEIMVGGMAWEARGRMEE